MTDLAPAYPSFFSPETGWGPGLFYLTLRGEYCMIRGDEPGKC